MASSRVRRAGPGPWRGAAAVIVVAAQLAVFSGSWVAGPCWDRWSQWTGAGQALLGLAAVLVLLRRGRLLLAALVPVASALVGSGIFLLSDVAQRATACQLAIGG